MKEKLESFLKQQHDQSTSSSFWERFRFLKTEGSRRKHLKRLREWNRDMDLFVQRACGAADRRKAASMLRSHPSSQLRKLSRRLFSTLSRCWTCQCASPHEARFSLESCGKFLPETQSRESGLFFNFLVSQLHTQGQEKWLEAKVTINASQ
jgi:hypothetical protein